MEDSVDSLYVICLQCCAQDPRSFSEKGPVTGEYRLRDGLQIPGKVCEDLLQARQQVGLPLSDDFLHAFSDPMLTRLQNIDLSYAESISSRALRWLLAHEPIQLLLPTHSSVNGDITEDISRHSPNLQVLHLASNGIETLTWGLPALTSPASASPLTSKVQSEHKRLKLNSFKHWSRKSKHSSIVPPSLRSFAVNSLPTKQESKLNRLLSTTPYLALLDLSNCNVQVHLLDCLAGLHNLNSLLLHNVRLASHGRKAFEIIGQLSKLRVLDISSDRQAGRIQYKRPQELLQMLMKQLQQLEHLDISCTNLPHPAQSAKANEAGGIAGLEERRLEFLGLLGCDGPTHSTPPSHWPNLPATKVSGYANLEQLLVAMEMYANKPALLHLALLLLLKGVGVIEMASQEQHQRLLQVLLRAMQCQPYHTHVQILAIKCLYKVQQAISNTDMLSYKIKRYLVNQSVRCKDTILANLNGNDLAIFRRVTESILSAIERSRTACPETTFQLLRTAGVALLRCKLPQENEGLLRRLTDAALRMVQTSDPNRIVETLGVCLVNRMSAFNTKRYKDIFSEMGGIRVVLGWLKERRQHSDGEVDKHHMWRTLWSLTDECPANCEQFISLAGMDIFYKYAEHWAADKILLVELFGITGNVVEVDHLRPVLHCSRFINLLRANMEYEVLNFELSNIVCSTLVCLLMDGRSAWRATSVSRTTVMHQLTEVMKTWNVNIPRILSPRTFEPLLLLLTCYDVPCAQFYAAWEISNVTRQQPDLYRTVMMDPSSNLLTIVQEVLAKTDSDAPVNELLLDLLDLHNEYLKKTNGREASTDKV